ncbi:Leucine-rich repeat - like 10, partial [Theobroma cacao]
ALFCLWNSASASPLVAPNGVGYEVLALIGIKRLLVDPHKVLDNWDDSSRDPCSWNMVTCSPDGFVVGLGAPSQNLSGFLSPTIGNLTNIQMVLLQNNNISGDIPSEIGSLSKLETLDLSNNNFAGQIPSTLSHLTSLQYLRLANNSLSGEIPASLANLTQLHLLDLSFNNLSGDAPTFPAKVFRIEGNPYICTNGAEQVGCGEKETGSLPSSSSSKAKLNYPSGIFHVIIILVSYSLDVILHH